MAQANVFLPNNPIFDRVVKAQGGNAYTWNNVIPAKTPLAGKSNGKLVLFDNSHGETAGQADWVIDGGFSDFADDLVNNGYTVKEYRGVDKDGDGVIRYYDDRKPENVNKNEAVITYDAIKDADVFVMAEANRPFTIAEHDALKKFVDSGKGIYFISDHYNADRNTNTWDGTEVFDGYNRSTASSYNMGGAYGDLRNPQSANKGWLAENFGIRFRFNALDLKAGFSGIKSPAETEGITQGVKPILMAAGGTLSIVDGNKAKGLVYLSPTDKPVKWNSAADDGLYFGGEKEGAFVAISKPSKGKAAFIGDSSPIEDDTTKYRNESDGSIKKTHPGYKSAGSAATLSVNIINWLAKSEDYVGFDGTTRKKGVNTPEPMADMEKDETQAEPWSTPKYDPWNTDTFAPGSYNAPQPSNSPVKNTPVTGVNLDKTSLNLSVNGTASLTATVLPANATNKNLVWKSSDETVVTANNGILVAKKVGSVTITVTTVDGRKTATCNVTVTNTVIPTPTGNTFIKEGFDTLVGGKSGVTSGIPSGWTFSGSIGVYTTSGNYGKSSPALKLQASNSQITTPEFKLSATGVLSFFLKGNQPDDGCHLIIEGYNGNQWTKIADIDEFTSEATTLTYDINKAIKKVRFTYIRTSGNLALDDISITQK